MSAQWIPGYRAQTAYFELHWVSAMRISVRLGAFSMGQGYDRETCRNSARELGYRKKVRSLPRPLRRAVVMFFENSGISTSAQYRHTRLNEDLAPEESGDRFTDRRLSVWCGQKVVKPLRSHSGLVADAPRAWWRSAAGLPAICKQ